MDHSTFQSDLDGAYHADQEKTHLSAISVRKVDSNSIVDLTLDIRNFLTEARQLQINSDNIVIRIIIRDVERYDMKDAVTEVLEESNPRSMLMFQMTQILTHQLHVIWNTPSPGPTWF
eukprot:PhF_6_TR8682/c0_g2_i6/m.13600